VGTIAAAAALAACCRRQRAAAQPARPPAFAATAERSAPAQCCRGLRRLGGPTWHRPSDNPVSRALLAAAGAPATDRRQDTAWRSAALIRVATALRVHPQGPLQHLLLLHLPAEHWALPRGGQAVVPVPAPTTPPYSIQHTQSDVKLGRLGCASHRVAASRSVVVIIVLVKPTPLVAPHARTREADI
jgi:hypothetical protein